MYVMDASQSITSDVLVWQGSQYRILTVKQYLEEGYDLAIQQDVWSVNVHSQDDDHYGY